jgi:hypothetical protein
MDILKKREIALLMFLDKEEERIYDGERGLGEQRALKLLVALGEAFDADRLIKITRAHYAGPGLEGDTHFAEELAEGGARCVVGTTTNPWIDERLLDEIKVSDYELNLWRRSRAACTKLEVWQNFSCTPYLLDNIPRFGEQIAFSESSATPYVNAVFGARTNRESSSSALAAGVIGKTANYGYHIT